MAAKKLLIIDEEITKLQLELCLMGHDDRYMGISAEQEESYKDTFKHDVLGPIFQEYGFNIGTKDVPVYGYKEGDTTKLLLNSIDFPLVQDQFKKSNGIFAGVKKGVAAVKRTFIKDEPKGCWYITTPESKERIYVLLRIDGDQAMTCLTAEHTLGEKTYDKLDWILLWRAISTHKTKYDIHIEHVKAKLHSTNVPPFNRDPPRVQMIPQQNVPGYPTQTTSMQPGMQNYSIPQAGYPMQPMTPQAGYPPTTPSDPSFQQLPPNGPATQMQI